MKNWILITVVIVVLLVLYWAYKKYIYFPHAKVVGTGLGQIYWTNDGVSQNIIKPDCSGVVGGSYGGRHEYQVQCLPNKQFRFFVHKMGQPNAIVVDNIYSFTSPPLYLTK